MTFSEDAVMLVMDRTDGQIGIGANVQFIVTTQERCYEIATLWNLDKTELDLFFYPEEPIITP